MQVNRHRRPLILVVEDVEETRHGIELLLADGYQVLSAGDEAEAVLQARLASPDLILMSLGVDTLEQVAIALRVRECAVLGDATPIVLFCIPTLDEGAEIEVAPNLYLTRPDNFDQLRRLFRRLLLVRQPC